MIEPRVDFPLSFEKYFAALSVALLMVKRSDPSNMLAAAKRSVLEFYEDEVQPYDAARCILDDAMCGEVR